jgi:hypothetical protein
MALSQTFEYCGVTVKDGYLKVSEIAGNKNGIGFTLAYKANANAEPIKHEQFNFAPLLDGDNFIAQAYEHLKQLPQFADAFNC